MLLLVSIPLPIFGKLADKYSYKKMLIYSTASIIFLITTLCFLKINSFLALFVCILVMIAFACLYAILPFILTDLFPSSLRFTGIALTFNIADSLEGLTPVIGFYLLHTTKNSTVYFSVLILFSIISLLSYFKIKYKKVNNA
jgi:MHS family proline/betaine transporter-like MFS transporter